MRSLLATTRALFACALFALSCAAVLPPLHASLEPIWWMATESALYGCMIALVVLLTGMGDTRVPGGLVLASASAALFAYVPISALWMGQRASFVQNPAVQHQLWNSPYGWPALIQPPDPTDSRAPLVISDLPDMTIQVFPGRSVNPKPTLIILEGSDWTRDGGQSLPWANLLSLHGYPVLNVSQDQSEAESWGDEAWPSVLKWLRREGGDHGLSHREFYLMGQGAGGLAALQVAYRSPPPGLQGVIVWSTPTDLSELWSGPSEPWLSGPQRVLAERLGGPPEQRAEAYQNASPVTFSRGHHVRTLVGCGGRDLAVPTAHCELLRDARTKAGSKVENVTIPWATSLAQTQPFGPSGILWHHAVLQFLTPP